MNILIIPEDFRKDQYILRPVVKAILSYLKKPNANVRVCQDPLLGGISQALQWRNIAQIIEMYDGMVDIFLLLVDRDGQPGRRTALDAIELQAASALPPKRRLLRNMRGRNWKCGHWRDVMVCPEIGTGLISETNGIPKNVILIPMHNAEIC